MNNRVERRRRNIEHRSPGIDRCSACLSSLKEYRWSFPGIDRRIDRRSPGIDCRSSGVARRFSLRNRTSFSRNCTSFSRNRASFSILASVPRPKVNRGSSRPVYMHPN